MKHNLSLAISLLATLSVAGADHPAPRNPDPIIPSTETHIIEPGRWDPSRPDSHAPIGVMGDHTHHAGGLMFSYRYKQMSMGGQRAGTDSLSSHQVFARGFDAAATQMDMHMHMFGLMYAPVDFLTLFGMANYVEKDMRLKAKTVPHEHGATHGHTGSFGHSSSGLGDVSLGALIKIFDANHQRFHINLGLGLPSASTGERQDGEFLPYGMQLGAGTWNIKPGITYLGQADRFSWGLQTLGNVRLEGSNDSGFGFGDRVNTTGWLAIPLKDWLSLSARLNYLHEEAIDGHYHGAHGHLAPPQLPKNYGGDYLEGGIGLNFVFHRGLLRKHRVAVEYLFPLAQDLNGIGMERDHLFTVGWKKGW